MEKVKRKHDSLIRQNSKILDSKQEIDNPHNVNLDLALGDKHKESDINDIKKNLRDVHDKTLKSRTVNLIREIMQQRNSEASQDLIDLGRQQITKKRVMKL